MKSKIAIRNSKSTLIHSLSSDKKLLRQAAKALKWSYSPYSKFMVGAAVQLSNGAIYLGANLENASYPLCLCAERTALAHAHMSSAKSRILSMAVVCTSLVSKITAPGFPCGACRQVISEFEDKQSNPIRIIIGMEDGSQLTAYDSIKDLLPHAFGGSSIQ